jgi:hypothetical protein
MYQKEEERRREMEKFASNKVSFANKKNSPINLINLLKIFNFLQERRRQTIQNVQRQWLEQKHCMSFYPSSSKTLSSIADFSVK